MDATSENALFLIGIWSVYTLDSISGDRRKAVLLVEPYENTRCRGMLPLPVVSASDVSCWPAVTERVASIHPFKASVNPDVINRTHIMRMVLDRVWEVEKFGQSSCARDFVKVAVACLSYKFTSSPDKQGGNTDMALLEELQVHLTHFCDLLYGHFIELTLTFCGVVPVVCF